jgi:hypothetical protein
MTDNRLLRLSGGALHLPNLALCAPESVGLFCPA